VVLAASVALCLVPASAPAQQRTISVTGDATLSAANDTARISFSVEALRGSRSSALGVASRRLRGVLGALRANGVAASDTRTGAISIRRERVRTRRGRVVRYRARSGVRAVVRPASRSGDVVDAAVKAGASVSSGPTFFVADGKALQRRALVAAFANARAKAAALAGESGLALGRPLSVRESTFVAAEPPSDDQQNAETAPVRGETTPAPAPTRPGTTSVDATVYVVFDAG
jgi:uncharacterized protein YggE